MQEHATLPSDILGKTLQGAQSLTASRLRTYVLTSQLEFTKFSTSGCPGGNFQLPAQVVAELSPDKIV